ncbi:GMC family oxidoreductase N-terminal domain-containing protein [Rhodanobacter sp. MP7CTX1]|uniref:GMC family oxidoreductase n=1 Tax=Rhodanobacter sp. MP7CTX1 TaxID=2723084 RepID=UPI0016196785|nr:GMC family oxidoreductase N-terminal domain-containing protein [Rhodanobacter sp. MP7CTX1]MBB6188564.1 choline dehydrogenase [Rhodanobacter sp. MP7CTX1]
MNQKTKQNDATFDAAAKANQAHLASNIKQHYDYIVCGAGTAGSVVAARLAENPDVQVLLLEAGADDDSPLVQDPNLWPYTLGTDLDWGFRCTPNPHLDGRAIDYSMGKVLGGGSSINVSTWSRGHQADWNHFAEVANNASWRYDSVLALYKSVIEAYSGQDAGEYRGRQGKVPVRNAVNPAPFAHQFLVGAQACGLRQFSDPNGEMMESDGGCAFVDETVVGDSRCSIFQSYVRPLMGRSNLTVLTGALVKRIIFQDRVASKVVFSHRGEQLSVGASVEIVLSMGAINTPKILMLSGIGDGDELSRFNIPLVQHLPGVGKDLHDHVSFGCVWENGDDRPPQIPRSQVASFWKSRADLDSPNFYSYAIQSPIITPENASNFKPSPDCWSMVVGMRPQSRGSVSLASGQPSDAPQVNANYLAEPQDLADLIEGLNMVRAIGNSSALKDFRGGEVAPGALSDGKLKQFLRNGLTTFWHPCGTARMGTDDGAVVDGTLLVHGVSRLRIADSSVMPRVTTGNTMAPCVVIGEIASELMTHRRH